MKMSKRAKLQKHLKETTETSENSLQLLSCSPSDSKIGDFLIQKYDNDLQDEDILNSSSVCSTCFLVDCECSRQDFFSQLEGLNSFKSESEEQKVSASDLSIKESLDNLFSNAFAQIDQDLSERSDNSTSITESSKFNPQESSDSPKDQFLSSHDSHFKCKDCLIDFKTAAKLKYHRLKLHGKWKTGVKCEICSKVFGTDSNRRRHLRTAHKAGPLVKIEPSLEGAIDVKSPDSEVRDETKNKISGPKQCPHCAYSSYDQYHLTIHLKKHTGERPFKCDQCSFGFYKKSDLKLHSKSCRGIKHQCPQCQQVFHFKKQLQEHEIWSETCGKIPNDGTHLNLVKDPGKRYLNSKPALVRVNVSSDQSIVGVNLENLIDQSSFVRRKNKARCGLCSGCEREQNCGTCCGCNNRRNCDLRRCLNRLVHYDLKLAAEEI